MTSGKPDDGGGGGSWAGGAGSELVVGDHVDGPGVGVGDGDGVGVGVGAGVGEGTGAGGAGVGLGLGCRGGSAPLIMVVLPHPARIRLASRINTKSEIKHAKEREKPSTTMNSNT